LIGIALCDHVIIGKEGYYSFREKGHIITGGQNLTPSGHKLHQMCVCVPPMFAKYVTSALYRDNIAFKFYPWRVVRKGISPVSPDDALSQMQKLFNDALPDAVTVIQVKTDMCNEDLQEITLSAVKDPIDIDAYRATTDHKKSDGENGIPTLL